eukprot:CAMPEP_0119477208 /NCGR_PEP_ID=MMETSP1344-20130328/7443_1 /TAXON_ID=236787 /ORGANISM="Florenciella parvula, Strain CCMP2471" /LENGTH=174 /DNA_ID=CAMNT_0007511157 /DNA_START=744 /DNA_END=1265 /DNA_ORIENTATION=+
MELSQQAAEPAAMETAAPLKVSLTEALENKELMGVYELCDVKAPSGSLVYVNHRGGDNSKPKLYLFRGNGSTHDEEMDDDGKWIVSADKNDMATNEGYIFSTQKDAEVPTAAGLTWEEEGLVVTEGEEAGLAWIEVEAAANKEKRRRLIQMLFIVTLLSSAIPAVALGIGTDDD